MTERIDGVLEELPVEGHLPPFEGATTWLNSPPLTPGGLRGKVVAVNFCTYTCINWIRTLPYVRAWAKRYEEHGLVVIGAHTPEFSVEKDIGNIRRALREMGVEYPVAVDSDHAIWDAFANRYWPALYLVDAQGRIRHHRFGEGDYEGTERIIRQLLAEAGTEPPAGAFVSGDARGPEIAADWDDLRSPETYVGYGRAQSFRPSGGMVPDEPHPYAVPEELGLGEWALLGDWTIEAERAVVNAPDGRIAFRFHARDLHLVMGPIAEGASISFRVSLDGRPPGDGAGGDVDADGSGTLDYPRLYQLIRQAGSVAPRLFEIEFVDRGAQALVFTFG